MIERTAMPSLLLVLALAAASAGIVHAADTRAFTLMRDHKCYVCHGDDDALAGPAFRDVAAAYRGNANAPAIIATLIRAGASDGGPWHMPPHPELSAAEATAIARYILSIDRRSAQPDSAVSRLQHQPATASSPRS
jgi:cytochrome c